MFWKPKELNSRTPKWFKDWYMRDFVPMRARQDIMILILTGIFIALVIRFMVY